MRRCRGQATGILLAAPNENVKEYAVPPPPPPSAQKQREQLPMAEVVVLPVHGQRSTISALLPVPSHDCGQRGICPAHTTGVPRSFTSRYQYRDWISLIGGDEKNDQRPRSPALIRGALCLYS
jgi:hypothetical protein